MKFLVVFLCLTCTVLASLEEQWTNFKIKHDKTYKNLEEDRMRFSVYQQNLQLIEEHNKKYQAGNTTYFMAVNQFADMTREEIVAFLKRQSSSRPELQADSVYTKPAGLKIPDSKDWRENGAVSAVKDQGPCSSCWAFAATGVLESHYYLKKQQMLLFSEQQLIDCDKKQGGCHGGWIINALHYIKDNGIQTQDSYPYEAVDNTCRYNQSAAVNLHISKVVKLKKDEDDLLSAVGSVGPVVVYLHFTPLVFYGGGVFSDRICSNKKFSHDVLAVGYGSENGVNYWIMKNSWGEHWGENGYFKLRRGTDECGVSTRCLYPVLN